MPDPRVRDVIAAEPLGARTRAPVRFFPVGEVVLVEESDDIERPARYQHAHAVRVVTRGNAVELTAVQLAPADLLGSGGPNADTAAGRVDDFGIRIEVSLGAESRTIVSGRGSLNKRGEKRRV